MSPQHLSVWPGLGLEISKLAGLGAELSLLPLEILSVRLSAVLLSFTQSVSWIGCLLEGGGQGQRAWIDRP